METAWPALPGLFIWAAVLALPWQPWRMREQLDSAGDQSADLRDVTVLIPARNEAAVIADVLCALGRQGRGLRVVLINDQSTDSTLAAARRAGLENLAIVDGKPPPPGWSGKLWALHQGLSRATTEYALLLDADIQLAPGTAAALKARMQEDDLHLASLMALLPAQSFWEKLLLPAFVYFFKLLYPFRLSNSGSSRVAAAAGGCILLRTAALARVGGFESIKGRLIDDCALARRFRDAGLATWIGLTRSALSRRRYHGPGGIWRMVARTAFTQLRYSYALLVLCSVLLATAFAAPAAVLLAGAPGARLLAGGAVLLMAGSYLPTLRYYRLNPLWALALPPAGMLYLLMTWDSARRYRSGIAATWKNRNYGAPGIATEAPGKRCAPG